MVTSIRNHPEDITHPKFLFTAVHIPGSTDESRCNYEEVRILANNLEPDLLHDLMNFLTVILGQCDLLEITGSLRERSRIEAIRLAANRMASLIEDERSGKKAVASVGIERKSNWSGA